MSASLFRTSAPADAPVITWAPPYPQEITVPFGTAADYPIGVVAALVVLTALILGWRSVRQAT